MSAEVGAEAVCRCKGPMIKKHDTFTYISLFSCAGVGCYGFKQEGFECVATNELLSRRLEVQRYNSKCRFESGYISGDITLPETKQKIYDEIEKWRILGNDGIDVVVATPPCQGISVINHKKNDRDIDRNSLVVESVELVRRIRPKVFIFENVQAFQKTLCVTPQDEIMPIGAYVRRELGSEYVISGRILNFMNYGSNSSRTRTLMIGVDVKYRNTIVPYDLYPEYRKEPTLREVISGFPPLNWAEIDPGDFYHAFRTYDASMRMWIHDLREGESAFDNVDPARRPHRMIGGKRVENICKNRDKYTRQKWDRFIQCIHTRNDQLAAQNTIHPREDRVFSIRELMSMMTIPLDFQWLPQTLEELNALSGEEKRRLYAKHETNVRQCIGEAVPTAIMLQIARKFKEVFRSLSRTPAKINDIIAEQHLEDSEKLRAYVSQNPDGLSVDHLMRVAELCNARREENEAFYTNKFMVNDIMNFLPDFSGEHIRILEPSVGVGSFLPFLFKRYADVARVDLDLVDIDSDSIENLQTLLARMSIPTNFRIRYFCDDFLAHDFNVRYDLIVGNPPYAKIKGDLSRYMEVLSLNVNQRTHDAAELFLEKCMRIGGYVALVLNKTLLSSDEYEATRDLLRRSCVEAILDFGRYGFTGVSIETMCLMVIPRRRPALTTVYNMKYNILRQVEQLYITDRKYPYFIIYRDAAFDAVAAQMEFGVFSVFRDRQITKGNTSKTGTANSVRVLKARNITDDGRIVEIEGYDTYIDADTLRGLAVFRYCYDSSVYLTPNMTYNPRVIRNTGSGGTMVPDGSVAILIPKRPIEMTEEQLKYYSTDEYRKFYAIARNLSTQSINIDRTSVFFFGVKRHD